jgi:hypothetical protein
VERFCGQNEARKIALDHMTSNAYIVVTDFQMWREIMKIELSLDYFEDSWKKFISEYFAEKTRS